MCEQTWVDEELGTADFGDVRLNRRCQMLVGALGAQCQGSIPVACQSWAVQVVGLLSGSSSRSKPPPVNMPRRWVILTSYGRWKD